MIRNILLIILALVSGSSQAQMGGWINTGPVNFPENVSGQIHGIGRVSQIKFHASNPQKMYAVSASGGLFITTNNGVNWAPAPGTDQLPATSCSAVCIDQTNDNIIYLSLGDADYYSNHFGIFKSTDGGSTWNPSNTGIGNAMAVEILMDPSNTNILVAATSSGIWRSTNAGASWIQELPGAFRDMKQRPGSTTDLYAVTASSFFRSTDFGNTWTSVTSGVSVPAGNGGMRIAVSNANPSIVYLATTSGNGRILKSLNSGVSFSTVYSSNTQCLVCYEGSPASGSQGNYNIDINANPQNAEELLLVAHTVWGSVDGGVTWSQRTDWWAEVHTDMHQIEFNPHNNSQIFNANDGGVWLSTDPQAAAWSPRSDGIAASEVYHAAQSPVLRQMVSIGTQDNGELYFPGSWKTNRGGDWNMKCAIDYTSGAQVYYLGSGDRRMLAPHSGEQSYNPPFAPTNNACMAFVRGLTGTGFLGVDSLFRSTNLGNAVPSWSLIWPSTARIRDIHSSRSDSNVLYVVTNNNNLFRSDNALSSSPVFTQLSTPGSSFLTASITTNRYNANMVYLSCGSQVYLSSNKGQTWTNISGNLPGLNIRKIIHDEYAMTERLFVNPGSYVYYKDGGNTGWTNHPGLPTVANVTDFMIYNDGSAASVLRLSSYGRGVWECDINNHLPPAPEFYADREMICPGDTVRFYKTVYGAANSVAWSFPGGTPSTSSLDTPIIVFNSVGTYDVSLTASGPGGNGVKHKAGYIIVTNGQSTAVQEGFQGLPFLPQHWQLISQSGVNWVQSWLAGGFGLSTRSAVFRNYSNDTEGDHDRLVCPQVDLSGISNARLLFDVAYAPFSAANPDSLIVSVSTDCGQSFTPVYVKSGTSLATAPALTTAAFVPFPSQWRKDTVNLSAYLNMPVIIAFENIGHFGQDLYIDNVNLQMSPIAAFTALDSTICEGDTVFFTDQSSNASFWNWTLAGGSPSAATVEHPAAVYYAAGTYNTSLSVSNSLGSSAQLKTGYITVAPGPQQPSINVAGNLFSASPSNGFSYQWYQNGNVIIGATGFSHTASSPGIYTVKLGSSNNCSRISLPFYYQVTDVTDPSASGQLSVFPNPTTGGVTLSGYAGPDGDYELRCYNSAGLLVLVSNIPVHDRLDYPVDFAGKAPGVYQLMLTSKDGRFRHQLSVLVR